MVKFHILKKKYNHIAELKEYNNSGNLHFYLKNIDLKFLNLISIGLSLTCAKPL